MDMEEEDNLGWWKCHLGELGNPFPRGRKRILGLDDDTYVWAWASLQKSR